MIDDLTAGASNGTFNGLAEGAAITANRHTLYADRLAGGGNDSAPTVTPVPEPGTWIAGILAVGTLGCSRRRRVRGFPNARRRRSWLPGAA